MNYRDREVDIVKMLADGWKVSQIAPELGLAVNTTETYIEKIRAVYGATNATHLVAIFFRNKLIE